MNTRIILAAVMFATVAAVAIHRKVVAKRRVDHYWARMDKHKNEVLHELFSSREAYDRIMSR